MAGLVANGYYERATPLLAGAVVLLFLVLCANVCSLLLARLTRKRREVSLCAALGASRGRLLGQAFIEHAIVGAIGVAGGMALAWTMVSVARAFLPEAFLLRTLNPLNVDGRALAMASLAGILAILASGLLPAWIGTRDEAGHSARITETTGTEPRGARAFTRVLLTGEVALASALLVSGTLLVRSFVNLAQAERGLDVTGVLTATVSLPSSSFPTPEARQGTARLIEDAVRQLPGVAEIAWSYGIPPDGGVLSWGVWAADGPGARSMDMEVESYYVGPEFFRFYGIPLTRGRSFRSTDGESQVIVGERFARALWGARDPVGRTFTFDNNRFEVIGVARELHYPALEARLDRPEFYHSFRGIGNYPMMSIRCGGTCPDPARVWRQLASVHPAVSVVDVQPLSAAYFEQLARPRAVAALGFAFALTALLAAAGGVFSVLSYAVARRRREFGIRSALGASPRQVQRLVLRDGLRVVLTGGAIGAVFAIALARAIASLQYGVTISDPVTWSIVLGAVGLTGVAACWRPSCQAMRVNPIRLLREE